MSYKLVDAKGKIMGRLCSFLARHAQYGENIVIINAKDAVVTGSIPSITKWRILKQNIHTHANPKMGPFWPHRPDTLLRRCLRGMLPKNDRGARALKRVRVFVADIPDWLKHKYPIEGEIKVLKADGDKTNAHLMTLGELSYQIGWESRAE
ncbi:MAG TPA: 50S ribosomal protein L13 [Candidatus Lokiarchaeia archaeon]|nr:50S ribosomal protein L13 [Candidatus Lokiarchaeia archaeon]